MKEKRYALALILSLMVVMAYSQIVIAPKYRNARGATVDKDGKLIEKVVKPEDVKTAKDTGSISELPSTSLTQTDLNPDSEKDPKSSESGRVEVTAVGEQPKLGSNISTQHTITKDELRASKSFKLELVGSRVSFTTLGARVSSFKTDSYKEKLDGKSRYDFINFEDNTPLPFGVYRGEYSDAKVQYELVSVTGVKKTKKENVFRAETTPQLNATSLVFKGTFPDGNEITKTFTFSGIKSYEFSVDVSIAGQGVKGSPIWLEWSQNVDDKAVKSRIDPWFFLSFTRDEDFDRVAAADFLEGGVNKFLNIRWLTLADKYFTGAIVSKSEKTSVGYVGRAYGTYFTRVSGDGNNGSYLAYLGPKDKDALVSAGFGLRRALDLGIFAFVAEPLLMALNFLFSILGNYGLAIIALTLLVKTALLPFAQKTFNSMQAMQTIQPEVKRIQEKYENDKQKAQQEIFALYKEKGVNPLGGCLPMVFQLPIFFGLYNALSNSVDLRHAPFALWINDLSATEKFPLFADYTIPVMVILMGASMLFQQMTQPNSATMDQQQRRIMYLMPVMFTVMFFVFPIPSGLVLYMLVNNTISVIQQSCIRGKRKISPWSATVVASLGIFGIGLVATML